MIYLCIPGLASNGRLFFKKNNFFLAVVCLCCCAGFSIVRCAGFSLWCFSCCRAWALRHTGFRSCGSQALEHRPSVVVGARASLLRGTQDLPRSGIEPVSPALAGGLFTTETPRKSLTTLVLMCFDVGRTNPFCSYYSSFTIYSSTIWVCLFLTVFPTTILVFSHIRPTTWLIYGHFYFAKIIF